MLYLVTGRPGNGKTLWVIDRLRKFAAETGRPVYYNGILLTEEGSKRLAWVELADATTWHCLGATALVVIDEAQRFFRPRPRGAAVPEHSAEFETHRHSGIDVYLLTQDPMLIDSHVRKLVGKHVHIKRVFGTEFATVTEWNERCANDPTKKSEYADSRSAKWKYPRDVYGLYKSAEVHTHKVDLPWMQFAYIGAGVLFFAGAVWAVRHHFSHGPEAKSERGQRTVGTSAGATPASSGEGGVFQGGRRGVFGNPWAIQVQAPRVKGAPQTAPFYDRLQEPVQQPTVAGCMKLEVDSVVTCECRTRQGSVVDMGTAQCVELMHRGWFDPTLKPVDIAELQRARLDARDAATLAASRSDTISPAPTNASEASLAAPAVDAVPADSDGSVASSPSTTR